MSEDKTHMQSVSESFRSRAAAFQGEPGEDDVDTNQVQAMNASEHAGGQVPEGKQPVDVISDSPAGDLGFDPEPQPGADEDGFGGDAPEPEGGHPEVEPSSES